MGITKLLQSKKGTLTLLVLCSCSVAVLMGKIDGTSYAAVVATLASIYNFCQHRVDVVEASNTTVLSDK